MSLLDRIARLLSAEPLQAPPPTPVIVEVPAPAVPEPKASLEPEIPRGLTVAAGYAWRLLLLGGLVVGVFTTLSFFSAVTVPLAFAVLLTAMLHPVTERLKSWRWPNWLASAVALLGMLAIIGGLLVFVGAQVRAQWPELVDQSLDGFEDLLNWLASGPLHINADQLNEWFATAREWVTGQAAALASGARTVGGAVGSFVAGLATALVATFFFAAQGRQIFTTGLQVVPRHYREQTGRAASKGWVSLVAYMRSAVIVAAVDAVGVAVSAWALGVPLVAALLALTFFLSFIPIVGAVLAGFVAVLLALVAQGPVSALIMLGLVILVMQIEGNFLQPLVMGSAVDVHPLAVLLGITAGTVVSGILGALLAIPIVAFVTAFVKALRADAGEEAEPGLSGASP